MTREGKISRKICGTKFENIRWSIRNNFEIEVVYKPLDIVSEIVS